MDNERPKRKIPVKNYKDLHEGRLSSILNFSEPSDPESSSADSWVQEVEKSAMAECGKKEQSGKSEDSVLLNAGEDDEFRRLQAELRDLDREESRLRDLRALQEEVQKKRRSVKSLRGEKLNTDFSSLTMI